MGTTPQGLQCLLFALQLGNALDLTCSIRAARRAAGSEPITMRGSLHLLKLATLKIARRLPEIGANLNICHVLGMRLAECHP